MDDIGASFLSIFLLGYTDGMVDYSKIWHELLTTRVPRKISHGVRNFPSSGNYVFPDLSGIRGHRTQTMRSGWDGSQMPTLNDILASFATNGPLLPRLILTGALASPIVAVSLQRDTVDIGGNQGILSVGELPADIAAEDLNWVPLRRYTAAEGGLPAPDDFPNEVRFQCASTLGLNEHWNRSTPLLGKLVSTTYILMGGSCHGQP